MDGARVADETGFKIALAAVLACALQAPAQAATLETTGEIRARGWWLDNYRQSGERDEFWDQRLRLDVDWNVGELVRVHARADVLEGIWGDEGDTPAIVFDHANAQLILPGAPLKLFVGRQDVSWGWGTGSRRTSGTGWRWV